MPSLSRIFNQFQKASTRYKLLFFFFSVLLLTLPLAVFVALQSNDTRSKAFQTQNADELDSEPIPRPSPEYAKGQVLVKFRPDSTIEYNREKYTIEKGLIGKDIPVTEIENQNLSLDIRKILQKYDIKSIKNILPNALPPGQQLEKTNRDYNQDTQKALSTIDLRNLYKLTFDENIPVQKIIGELKHSRSVVDAIPNYKITKLDFTPNDPFFKFQWALSNRGKSGATKGADINIKPAWDITKGSEKTIIAIIDTGIDYTHPDLGGCIGPTCKVIGGMDFFNDDPDPKDDEGHGTHVAGIAAAQTNNSVGIAGTCPDCSLMAIKFLDDTGSGYSDDAIASINYAADNGANIINASWGSFVPDPFLSEAINLATAKGSLVIAAAGNDNGEFLSYPALDENVLSVGATNNNDKKASYSNYYATLDVSAPGGDSKWNNPCPFSKEQAIYSTITNGEIWDQFGTACGQDSGGGKYIGLSGTSMAAPHVSGVAGLLASLNPQLGPLEIADQIKYTTKNIDSINPEYKGKLGTGRVNAQKALSNVTKIPQLYFVSYSITPEKEIWPNGLVEPGETGRIKVTLTTEWAGANDLKAELKTANKYVTITGKKSNYGDILPHQNKENLTDFTFKIDIKAPKKFTLPFTMQSTYKDERNNEYTKTFSFRTKIALDYGWPKNVISNGFFFADLTDDNQNEIVLPVFAAMRLYKADGQALWNYSTRVESGGFYEESAWVGSAVGDIDGDGKKDIVGSTYGGFITSPRLFAFDHLGNVKPGWPKEENDVYEFSAPLLADIDNDGALEIIVSTGYYANKPADLRVYKGDGTLLWKKTALYESAGLSSVADLDNDGSQDIVTPVYDYTQEEFVGNLMITKADGTDYGTIPLPQGDFAKYAPVIGNLDADGQNTNEIIFTTFKGKLYVFDSNLQIVPGWPVKYTNPLGDDTSVAIGNIDNDNQLELVASGMGFPNKFYAWNYDATTLPGWPIKFQSDAGISVTKPVIGDIDGDGKKDILFGINDCSIFAYSQTGALLKGYPQFLPDHADCYNTEFILGTVGTSNKLSIGVLAYLFTYGRYDTYLLNTDHPYKSNLSDWPMSQHDSQQSGFYTPPEKQINPPSVLINPSFEDDTRPDNIPDGWTTKNLTNTDRLQDVAKNGVKSFRFTKLNTPSDQQKELSQEILRDGGGYEEINLAVWHRSNNTIKPGNSQAGAKIQVTYNDGGKEEKIVQFPDTAHTDWEKSTLSFLTPQRKTYKSVKIILFSKNIDTNYFIDAVNLTFNPNAGPTIPAATYTPIPTLNPGITDPPPPPLFQL